MLDSLAPVLALLGFVFVLGMVTWIKVRNLAEVTQWAAQNTDAPVRHIGVLCGVVALALAGALIGLGVDPPGAVAIAALCGLGACVALLGVLGMEGVLGEPESVAAARIAEGRPPPSSPRGRLLAVLAGVVPILVAAWLLVA